LTVDHRIKLLAAGLLLTGLNAEARIDAPDHIFYGNVTVFGDPAAPGQIVEARLLSTGEILARYELGVDIRLGAQYALRIPMDAVNPRGDGRARPGDPVNLLIGNVVAAETTVGDLGRAVRLDLDPQNLGTGPSLNVADITLFEGNAGTTPATFEFNLNTTSADPVVLFWQTEDDTATGGTACVAGIDYLVDQGTLSFPPGQQQGSVTILVCGDTVIEPTERFRLRFTGIQGGVLARPAATATIIDDDDVPDLRVADVTVTEPPSGQTTQAVFRPRLSKNSDFEARFDYTTEPLNAQPGIDYSPVSGTIMIAAGDLDAEIAVPVLHVPDSSAPKSFQLRFSNPFNLVLDIDRALGVILDPSFRPAVEHEQDLVNGEDVIGMAGPTALALSPDGTHAYVTSEALDALLLFNRNPGNGRLSPVEGYDSARTGFEQARFDGPIDVVVSPDGAHVYVAARNDSAIAVLGRNPATGRLGFVQNQVDGILGAPDANGPNVGLAGVRRLLLSADGLHLYAAGSDANSVAVFERDPSSGELRFLEAETNGQNDPQDPGPMVVAMSRPSGLALSPNGADLYVASRFGDAVQVFARDDDPTSPDFGRLSYVTVYENGLNGIVGLDGAFDIAVTGDGAHVYVTAEAENAIVLFDRGSNGLLGQRSVFRHQTPERPGLIGVQGLAVSPDGLEVFAAGFTDSSLSIFERIGADDDDGLAPGELRLRQTLFDDQGQMRNLAGATRVTPSADDQFVYVVANQDNAIVVLRRISLDVVFIDDFEAP